MINNTKKIINYCLTHSDSQEQILLELERETHLKTLAPQMISGHLQGLLLSFISKMMMPENILEIGTFTGYSAICLAKGLTKNGTLHTIEVNEEYSYIAQKYFNKSGLGEQIKQHIGDAKKIIPTFTGKFDLVFIDAGKKDYMDFYHLVFDKVKKGGCIIADNVLWSGKVLEEETDSETNSIKRFNELIKHDNRVEKMMLPIRDGLFLIRKIV